MKRILILLITLANFALAHADDEIFNDLNGTASVESLYQNCQKMSAIWNEVKPVVAVPAVIGFEQGRTPMADLCYAVTQMKLYQGRLKELREKYGLEKQKTEGLEKKLLLAAAIYAMNSSTMDNNTEKTPRAIVAGRKRRQFSAFYQRVTGVSITEAALDPAKKEAFQRNEEIAQRLANISGRRAALASKMQCKRGQNENLKQRYTFELQPIQNNWELAADEREYYFQELLPLATKFKLERQALEYREELQTIDGNAIVLSTAQNQKEVDSAERKKQPDSSFKLVASKAKVTIQTFTPVINDEALTRFEQKWSRQWREAAKHNADQILDALERGADCEKVVNDYANMIKNPGQAKEGITRKFMDCQKKKEMTPKQAAVLFEDNWRKYKDAYKREKSLEAQMLTLESEMLGEPIAPSRDEMKRIIAEDKPQCDEELSVADMEKLKKEQRQLETELREIYAEGQIRKSAVMDARQRQRQEDLEFYERSRQMKERDAQETERNLKLAPRSASY